MKGERYTAFVHLEFFWVFFVLCESNGFLLTPITSLWILGLCFGSNLNKTLDISELCLRPASRLHADQEVTGRTYAIAPVSQADTLYQKFVYFMLDRGLLRQRIFKTI